MALADQGPTADQASAAPPTSPPAAAPARALVQDLIERLNSEDLDRSWLVQHLALPGSRTALSDAWVERWLASLQADRPLGQALRSSPGPIATMSGPAYQRVLLGPTPGLSAIVVQASDGPALRELAFTTCTLCSERVRFVADLLDEVQRRGRVRARLVPGIELDVDLASERHGSDWVGLLQQRNQIASYLERTLRGAEVHGEREGAVIVRYASGVEDRWRVQWHEDRWRVSYDHLAQDSPLRLTEAEARRLRTPGALHGASLAAYTPTFDAIGGGAGVEIGFGAVEAWPDPRDGTVLMLLMDLDRVFSGLVRVDPETGEVVDRWPVRLFDARTQLNLRDWDSAWQGELSADGSRIVVRGPGRSWILDLPQRRARLLSRGQLSWVGWSGANRAQLGRSDGLWSHQDSSGTTRLRAPTPIRAAWGTGSEHYSVSSGGVVFDLVEQREIGRVCCGYITDVAVSKPTGRALASCADPCDVAAVLVTTDRDPIDLPGAGTDRAGASLSPNGAWLTTGVSDPEGSLLLWSAEERRPTARLPVGPLRAVRWSPASEHLLTIELDGRVGWWPLSEVLSSHAL